MRKYQSHKVVEAEPITAYQNTITVKTVTTGDGVEAYTHEVPENFFARGVPEVGDYLVRCDDWYVALWPKFMFEKSHTLVPDGERFAGYCPTCGQASRHYDGIFVERSGRAFAITEEELEDGQAVDLFRERLIELLRIQGTSLPDKPRPTIAELEAILDEATEPVEIMPDGSVRTVRATGSVLQPDGSVGRVDVDPEKVRQMGRDSSVEDVMIRQVGERLHFDSAKVHQLGERVEYAGTKEREALADALNATDIPRERLVRYLIGRIAEHQGTYMDRTADGDRMEELSFLLMTAVQGGII